VRHAVRDGAPWRAVPEKTAAQGGGAPAGVLLPAGRTRHRTPGLRT